MARLIVRPSSGPLRGAVEIPGDKSISHRALMFKALAQRRARVDGFLNAADTRSTTCPIRINAHRSSSDISSGATAS